MRRLVLSHWRSCCMFLVPSAASRRDKIKVVTTIPDLADMARHIGGDLRRGERASPPASRTSTPCR